MNAAQHRAMEHEQSTAVLAHARSCLACKQASGTSIDSYLANCLMAAQIWRCIYWRWQRRASRARKALSL